MLPWLDQPVMLHSDRTDTCMLTAEQCAYRSGHFRYWYEADHVYALATVYFFVAAIGLCALGFWSLRLAPSSLRERAWWRRLVGGVRFLSYRHYDLRSMWLYRPSPGVIILLGLGFVFFAAMTLGPQPYYWPNTATLSFGGSPPLATRAGWMALACLPFMIILPTKANMIAALTGVSHERLIVFHKWVGWAMFVLALVHMFPFIIYHIQVKHDMTMQWEMDVAYWTGVAAIVPQAYLQFMSISAIRNRFYEFFKATHLLAAVLFVFFFFIHCDFRLSSWDYFIATGILYTLSFLYSQTRTYFEFGISHRASFSMVSDVCMKITIPIKTKWQPGQHMFLRFVTMGLHAFTAHPFTICSVPSTGTNGTKTKLVFYVCPRGGITGRLAKAAAKEPARKVPVLLDGPYGGIRSKRLYNYDRSVIVACGAGAALSLSVVMDTILQLTHQSQAEDFKPRHQMQVIIATRDPRMIEWYSDALQDFLEENKIETSPDSIAISMYQTGALDFPNSTTSVNNPESSGVGVSEKRTATLRIANPNRMPIRSYVGRPDIASIVREATLEPGVSVGVAACGPEGVLQAAQNAAADAQLRILASKPGAREVYLHSEVFSW